MLNISRTLVQQIIEHARSVAPEEACGVLAGSNDTVAAVYEAENVLHSSVEYLMSSQDQLRIMNEIIEHDLDDLAYYHSHPTSHPYPSATDVSKVVIGRARLVIITLQKAKTPIRSFFVQDGIVEEEEMQIIDCHDRE